MTKCNCTPSQSLAGDGCRYCNPQEHIDRLVDQTKDDQQEIERFRAALEERNKYEEVLVEIACDEYDEHGMKVADYEAAYRALLKKAADALGWEEQK